MYVIKNDIVNFCDNNFYAMTNFFFLNLKHLRGVTGETQASIASHVNKGRTAIANWENNLSQPNIDELIIVANIFDITLDELILVDLSKGNLNRKTKAPEAEQKGKANSKPYGNENANIWVISEPDITYNSKEEALQKLGELQQHQSQVQLAINSLLTGILSDISGAQ